MATFTRGSDTRAVGLLVLAALLTFGGLFTALTNRTLRRHSSDLFIRFAAADGLLRGDGVLFRGVRIGEVRSLHFDSIGSVVVQVRLSQEAPLSTTTTATLVPVDLFGRQSIVLRPGLIPGAAIDDGASLEGETPASMAGRLDAIGRQAEQLIGDGTTSRVHGTLDGASEAFRDLDGLLRHTDALLDDQRSSLTGATSHAARVAANLDAATDSVELAAIRDRLRASSESLADATARLDSLSIGLLATLATLQRGDGTAGRLLSNPALYDHMVGTLASLDELVRDVKRNPKRYISVSVF